MLIIRYSYYEIDTHKTKSMNQKNKYKLQTVEWINSFKQIHLQCQCTLQFANIYIDDVPFKCYPHSIPFHCIYCIYSIYSIETTYNNIFYT